MLKTVGNPSTRFGDQTINDGDLIIGTAGDGINFTANTPAAGMTSQLLDWYEEGTWTPAVTGSISNPTITYASADTGGFYTRIGNIVYFTFEVRWSAISGGSGDVRITGLPFARKSSTQPGVDCFALQSRAVTYSGDTLLGIVPQQLNYIVVETNDPAGGANIGLPVSGLGIVGVGFLRGSGFYYV